MTCRPGFPGSVPVTIGGLWFGTTIRYGTFQPQSFAWCAIILLFTFYINQLIAHAKFCRSLGPGYCLGLPIASTFHLVTILLPLQLPRDSPTSLIIHLSQKIYDRIIRLRSEAAASPHREDKAHGRGLHLLLLLNLVRPSTLLFQKFIILNLYMGL